MPSFLNLEHRHPPSLSTPLLSRAREVVSLGRAGLPCCEHLSSHSTRLPPPRVPPITTRHHPLRVRPLVAMPKQVALALLCPRTVIPARCVTLSPCLVLSTPLTRAGSCQLRQDCVDLLRPSVFSPCTTTAVTTGHHSLRVRPSVTLPTPHAVRRERARYVLSTFETTSPSSPLSPVTRAGTAWAGLC